MPSVTSLFAKFTTPGERGKILGCGSVFMSAADIIGPIVLGLLYRNDENLVWYAGGSSQFLAFILLRISDACLERMRRARKPLDRESLSKEKSVVDEDWVWEKDKDYTDEEYLKLGKRVGTILTKKNWRWVMKMDNIERVVNYSFPLIPKEVTANRRMWDDFWKYCMQIWGEISLIYNRRDEDYLAAESKGWDFSTVEHEPVDLLSKAYGK
jgi:hypothetical protein